ncbi:hypothetical protein ACFX2A_016464 [Malus domestica]
MPLPHQPHSHSHNCSFDPKIWRDYVGNSVQIPYPPLQASHSLPNLCPTLPRHPHHQQGLRHVARVLYSLPSCVPLHFKFHRCRSRSYVHENR